MSAKQIQALMTGLLIAIIQAGATIYYADTPYGYALPLLIARDVLETPVAVADTQDLEVKYTGKITV